MPYQTNTLQNVVLVSNKKTVPKDIQNYLQVCLTNRHYGY